VSGSTSPLSPEGWASRQHRPPTRQRVFHLVRPQQGLERLVVDRELADQRLQFARSGASPGFAAPVAATTCWWPSPARAAASALPAAGGGSPPRRPRVLPAVVVRQWVLSLPFALRFAVAFDRDLCREVRSIFTAAVLPVGAASLTGGVARRTAPVFRLSSRLSGWWRAQRDAPQHRNSIAASGPGP